MDRYLRLSSGFYFRALSKREMNALTETPPTIPSQGCKRIVHPMVGPQLEPHSRSKNSTKDKSRLASF